VTPDKKLTKIKTVLKELIEYTKTHFTHEERFMESINYPELKEHKILHKNIIKSMNAFTHKLLSMSIIEIEKELAHLIEVWFINHIIYVDKKISQWLLTHEIPEFTFSWKNSYSVEQSIIDAQHQELFKIASEAFKIVPTKEKMQKIKETLNKLFEYFNKHFADEEMYMKEIKYDKIEEHQKIHQEIIENLKSFIHKAPSMEIADIEEQLKDFIEDSLVKHIMEVDRKILLWNIYLKDLKEAKELKEI
jgi:hemerythrin